jgi:hypothetical protein
LTIAQPHRCDIRIRFPRPAQIHFTLATESWGKHKQIMNKYVSEWLYIAPANMFRIGRSISISWVYELAVNAFPITLIRWLR